METFVGTAYPRYERTSAEAARRESTMSQGTPTHLVIRSALAVALSLAIYAPVRAQSAPPPQETPAPAAPMTTMTPAGSASQGARQAASVNGFC